MKTLIVVVLFTLGSNFMNAQDFAKHQWKQRIIIVSSPTFKNTLAKEQLAALKKDLGAVKDRKLMVYHITNTGFTVDFDDTIKISENTETAISSFKVSLIGLDGAKKFQASNVQEAATFFNLIDTMPMRRAEIKSKNYE